MAHTCLVTFSLTDMTYIITNLETMKIQEFHCTQQHTVNYLFVHRSIKMAQFSVRTNILYSKRSMFIGKLRTSAISITTALVLL